MRRPGRWLTPMLCLPLSATGCGNIVTADVIGVAAVTRGADGHPVILVKVCSSDVDTLVVYRSRQGLSDDQPNVEVASWTTGEPRSGTIRFPVDRIPGGWSARSTRSDEVGFAPGQGYVVVAERSQQDAEVTPVSFRGRDLAHVKRGHVLVRDSETWTRQRFEEHACDGRDSA